MGVLLRMCMQLYVEVRFNEVTAPTPTSQFIYNCMATVLYD